MVARQQVRQGEQGAQGFGVGKVALEEMPSESSSTTTTSSSVQSGEAVRLRIASGGSFVTELGGKVKYVGGASYLDRIPISFKFADLSHRLAEKANGAVLVKYLVPGEPLDEDELVGIQDDLDIQEMYEEYGRAVQQAVGKPPRLRLFLTPAMEEDMTPEQYHDGNEFFAHAQADRFWGDMPEGLHGARPGTGKRVGLEHASSGHSSFSTAQPALTHHAAQPKRTGGQLGVRTKPAGKAWPGPDIWPPEGLFCDGDRTPDECGVTTPDPHLEELRLYDSWDRGGRSGGGLGGFHLPSHISAFGDGLRLPSYISAFGDGVRSEDRMPEHGGQDAGKGHGDFDLRHGPEDATFHAGLQGGFHEQAQLHKTLSNLKPVFRSVPHVPREAVKVLGTIAEGSFGEVSLAKTQQFGELAVKWLKCGKYERHLEHFWQEADLLAQLNHPNVLRLYGVVTVSQQDPSVVGIMTEYVRGGSLSANLRKFTSPLPLRFRAQLALQVAQGMSYLHQCNIVHFDLKPDNLLLDSPMQASLMYEASCHCTLKVADFGLSKEKQRSFVSGVRDLRGTLPFMAPELVNTPERINEKADCWSFGMLLWELLTLQSPFQELAPNHIIAGLMSGTLRPEIPMFCEQPWLDLMLACWALNPTQRPSFSKLAQQLEALIDIC